MKACEVCADRLKAAEDKAAVYEARLKLKDEVIAAKDQTIAVLTEQRDGYKLAAEKRNDALAGNDLRVQIFREQQADDKLEIARLRREIERLRNPGLLATIFKPQTITSAVLGYGFCAATRR